MREILRNDDGGVVVGWLTKVFVVVAAFGIVLFDFLAVVAGRVATKDDADTVAYSASLAYGTHRNVDDAYAAAVTEALEHDATVEPDTFSIAPDGTVQLVLRREVTTLMAYRIGPLKKYVVAEESGRGRAT